MRTKHIGVIVAVAGFGLAAAACSSSSAPASSSPAAKASSSVSSASTTATVGSQCSTVATNLKSKKDELAGKAASSDPNLQGLVAAAQAAGVTATLDSKGPITVFAPDNQAFQAVETQLKSASKTDVKQLLEYHVVVGKRVTPAELASGTPLTTKLGPPLHPGKSGSTYTVNGADVVCGNIQTKNATVYIINKVLTPTTS